MSRRPSRGPARRGRPPARARPTAPNRGTRAPRTRRSPPSRACCGSWPIDQDVCYPTQRQRQLLFNLFAAGVLAHALVPLARLFGDERRARRHAGEAGALLAATVRRFWDPALGVFVNNRPSQREDGGPRLCDRSIATALLFDQCPGGRVRESIETLVALPPTLRLSYPSNACWRYWALARHGRVDAVLRDLRERWATMPSVRLNNTIGEEWTTRPDSTWR